MNTCSYCEVFLSSVRVPISRKEVISVALPKGFLTCLVLIFTGRRWESTGRRWERRLALRRHWEALGEHWEALGEAAARPHMWPFSGCVTS